MSIKFKIPSVDDAMIDEAILTAVKAAFIAGAEFGFKCCENGRNFEKTFMLAHETMNEATVK